MSHTIQERTGDTDAGSHRESATDDPGSPTPVGPRSIGLIALALTVFLLISVLASIAVGTERISPAEVFDALTGSSSGKVSDLVWDYRIPRTMVAVLVGASLGVAGALIQAFTRNPLADPGILGVNAGAALSATLAVGFFGVSSISGLVLPALIGAALATLAVLLSASAGRGPATPLRMTLAGVALAAVLGGVTTAIRLSDPSTFDRMRSWAAGSVAGRSLDDLALVTPLIVVGLTISIGLGRPLNSITLGDETAAALGVNVRLVRVLTLLAVTLLVGSATAVAGPIGFIGLMVAHACRMVVGNDQTKVIVLSALFAPGLLMLSDILSRVVMGSRELPVGVVTAFVGAPVLIWLVRRKRVTL